MKRAWKILLIVGLCCFVVGLLLTGVCAAYAISSGIRLAGQLPERYRGSWTEESSEMSGTGHMRVELGSVSSLSLRLAGEPVTIKTGGDNVILEWEQDYEGQYGYSAEEGGRLSLSRKGSEFGIGWNFWGGGLRFNADGILSLLDGSMFRERFESGGRAVTVTLPEGTDLSAVTINTVSGDITIEGVRASSLTVDSVSAALSAARCSADTARINGVSGSAVFDGCELGSVRMGTVSGELLITGGRTREASLEGVDARLRADGAIGLERVTVSGVNADGDITLAGKVSDYRLEVSGLNAFIEADGERGRGVRNPGAPYLIRVEGLNAELRVRGG